MIRIYTELGSCQVPWNGTIPILDDFSIEAQKVLLDAFANGHYKKIPVFDSREPDWSNFLIALISQKTFRLWAGRNVFTAAMIISAVHSERIDHLQVSIDFALRVLKPVPDIHVRRKWEETAIDYNVPVFFITEKQWDKATERVD